MKRSANRPRYDAVIVGGGPVGYAAALALARDSGARLALVTGNRPHGPAPPDGGRTAALMRDSLDFLGSLGLGDAIEKASWPLAAIRMIDAKRGLIRAPTTTFRAVELGEEAFGRNIRNGELVAIMRQHAETQSIDLIDEMIEHAEFNAGGARLRLADGSVLDATLVVAADGRRSRLRALAGIAARSDDCVQTALTFHVHHMRDHEDVSTEYHTREGPFTLVPLGSNLSSVVWVVRPARARALLALDTATFALAAERECQSLLGRFELVAKPGSHPLVASMAERFSGASIVLAGEAAHAFPPIGAQGLNLGLRDAREIGRLDPLGSALPEALRRYDRRRRADALTRSAAVGLLNRSLTSGLLPVDLARAAGLSLLGAVSPLRKAAMRLGMGQSISPASRSMAPASQMD